MKTDRMYTMFCRKSFTKTDGSIVEKGTIFEANVQAYHSGALEFFKFTFPDNPGVEATHIPCIFARFHSVDEPSNAE